MNLRFGQVSEGTQFFFHRLYGNWHDVPLRKMPHYISLTTDDPTIYMEYLKASWGSEFTEEKALQRYRQFLALREDIATNGIGTPIVVIPTGRGQIIFDGNHRSAIAESLGVALPCEEWSVEKTLRQVITNPETYGTGESGVPYQPIYFNRREVISGRRRDVMERMQAFGIDFKGKSVLDIGCNYGASCYLAKEAGADYVMGVDKDPVLVRSALRINVFAGHQRMFFRNLNFETPQDIGRFDVVLCFSVYNHVSNTGQLIANIRKALTPDGILLFEGHGNSSSDNYAPLIHTFKSFEVVGAGIESFDSDRRNRPWIKCKN